MTTAPDTQTLLPFGRLFAGDAAHQLLGDDVAILRGLVRRHAVVVLRGVGDAFSDTASLAAFAERWGQVMMWSFGAVLEVDEHAEPHDLVFDATHLPLHWDGSYRDATPEFMMLFCRRSTAEGGRTLLVDTRRVLRAADTARSTLWARISVTYLKRGQVHYSGAAHSPLVVPHPISGEDVLRFEGPYPPSRPVLNPPTRLWHGIETNAVDAVEDDLVQRLMAQDCCLAHAWQAGDLVIGDNFALLHGREAFPAGSRRSLWRVQVHSDPVTRNAPPSDDAPCT